MKRKGFTLIELLVVIAIIALLMSILMPALNKVRQLAARIVCGSNCKSIGTAMTIYSNDNSGSLPIWGKDPNGWDNCPVTRSLFLLVKKDYTTIDQFICKNEGSTPSSLAAATGSYSRYTPTLLFKEPADFEDFGVYGARKNADGSLLTPGDSRSNTANNSMYNAGKHCSYSYHSPNQGDSTMYPPTSESGARFALLADKNPYIKDQSLSSTQRKISAPMPALTGSQIVKQNSFSHQESGQNVLFGDVHVEFAILPTVGVENDNIYTYWGSGGVGTPGNPAFLPDTTVSGIKGGNQQVGNVPKYGTPPARICAPQDVRDSLLLSEEYIQP
jgi:prepilin-type N-terminal cleavage/methylation domain-containing protein